MRKVENGRQEIGKNRNECGGTKGNGKSPYIFKAVDGDQKRWSIGCYSVFWAERIMTRKRMGCSPYFAVTGAHPLLPLDISESTYLLPAPTSILSSTDLIARRTIALQKRSEDINRLYSKVFEARLQAAIHFEKLHARTL